MANFCGKCGSRLDSSTGKCPQCGSIPSGNGHHNGKKIIRFLIIAAVIGSVLGATFLLYAEKHPEPDPVIPTAPTIESKPEISDTNAILPDFVEAYMQIIEDTAKQEYLYSNLGGQLHDMNDDGVPELAFIYNILIPTTVTRYDGTIEEVDLPYSVCDLYTYDNGEVINLLEQEVVYSAEGVCVDQLAFSEIEGQECLVMEGYGGPTGVGYSEKCQGFDADTLGDYTEGQIKLYTLNGSKLTCKNDVRYRYHSYAKNSNFSGTMNGTNLTEDEYRAWRSSLPPIGWFDQWCGSSVYDLQAQLKENNWTQVQASGSLWVEYPVESVMASSTYTGDNRSHSVSNLLDGDPQTNWTENIEGNGLGEWILFTFKDRYQLNSISICGGCRTDEAHYYDNARPKKVTLTFSDGSSYESVLNDNEFLSEQYIAFDTPVITESVKITIDSVYPGEKYEDTVVSDVFFGTFTVE